MVRLKTLKISELKHKGNVEKVLDNLQNLSKRALKLFFHFHSRFVIFSVFFNLVAND